MPMVQAVLAAPVVAAMQRHVFISYSHRDGAEADLPSRFMQELVLLVRGKPELGLDESRIFFDRRALLPGDDWDDSIQLALERAHLFVFLVSSQSLTSKYCISRELAVAAGRGIPIIPVLLTDCLWADQPVPGDPKQRRLGAFDATPKNDQGNAVPIRQWPDTDTAFKRALEQIGLRLARDAAALPPVDAPRRNVVPPLLPYRCNQEKVESAFDRGLRGWGGKALLVLVRGGSDDNPARFWDRLRSKNLMDRVDARQAAMLEPRPLKWPPAMDEKKLRKDIAADVISELSDALSGNRYKVENSAGLAAVLAKQGGVRALVATPLHEPAKALAASLGALLDLIEATPADTPLEQLVVALMLEEPTLLEARDLTKLLKLGSYQRTQVVELDALLPLTREHVRKWCFDNEIESCCGLDDQAMIARVFTDGDSMRLRRFDERVRPLLGIG